MRSRGVLARVPSVALALAIAALPGTIAADALGRVAERDGTGPPVFLHVSNIRLQEPAPPTLQPSALLRFDLTNDGLSSAIGVKLRIEIHEPSGDADAPARVLVRPFEVHSGTTIEPGFTVEYSILFRNLPFDCRCEANVTVVSASAVPNGSQPPLPTARKGP